MDLWDFEASLKLVPKTGSKATEKPCLDSKIKTKTQTNKKIKHKIKKKNSWQITIPENLDNNEDPKRDIYRSNLHQ